jgi:predicted DsbA family dithiol-disulfide isomerase
MGLVDRLKEKFDITETWLGYELHPETPVAGISLARRFSAQRAAGLYDNIRARGTELGLEFGRLALLSNSRFALEAGEYARDMGRYEAYHERMFRAYFTELQDIGNLDVISAVASDSGLDATGLRETLRERRYAKRREEVREEAESRFISGVPTFIVNDRRQIIGAQPLDIFEDLFRRLEAEQTS